ncbi:unnamed protein product [Caenorhabditis bovis]|uniref:Domain of unknown function DB domain-containing protein n=1 Tax=Caenorhabditis bovis TaxID=2654633 RepID=A0A8S1FF21_9PELO|nr:unnamed protein product [Caenorhabditis bovis]
MRLECFSIFLLITLKLSEGRLPNARFHHNPPSAFSLARIQKEYDDDYETTDEIRSDPKTSLDGNRRQDEVVNDAKCLQKCNNQLNIGMDMVNAHMAFGSIDVPSVVEKRDLELFCMLDYQHSQCIDECGYSVQFNLREYVCRNRLKEMLHHLSCYSKASPALIRHCRPRCGGYKPLVHTKEGYSQRCRQLLCDHTCTTFILNRLCPDNEGSAAARYLLDFTRLQVNYWMRDFAKETNRSRAPLTCRKLLCDGFKLGNCRRRIRKRIVLSSSN